MLMLSSSSTSPRSSRPTMLSSSRSAFSKLMAAMSGCFAGGLVVAGSTITVIPIRLPRGSLGASLHQRIDVHADRFGQRREVVAAFEHRHQPAARVAVRDVCELAGGPG